MNMSDIKRVHFIGVGGIGMCALAQWMLEQGCAVQGSDQVKNEHCQRLVQQGMIFFEGHSSEQVQGVDLIVYTSAVSDANCELQFAHEQGIACMKRGELLAHLVNSYKVVAIAGTHGKTTTTAMVTQVLSGCGQNPSAFIGGVVPGQEGPLRLGRGDWFVVESDESDGSFLRLSPFIAVVTNIDRDHLNNYDNDFDKLKLAFIQFLNSVSPLGFAMVNGDDDVIRSLLPEVKCRVLTYGFGDQVDYRVTQYRQQGVTSLFQLLSPLKRLHDVQLHLPGEHNVSNAAAAVAVADGLQLSLPQAIEAMAGFEGVGRRFSYHGDVSVLNHRVHCVEDYGHHPKAISVTIEAARRAWPNSRVVLVFQPHRYSRTRDLFSDFVKACAQADVIVLMNVYAASEEASEGVCSTALYDQLKALDHNVHFVAQAGRLLPHLEEVSQSEDVVLFQGAGNVGQFARQWAFSSVTSQ